MTSSSRVQYAVLELRPENCRAEVQISVNGTVILHKVPLVVPMSGEGRVDLDRFEEMIERLAMRSKAFPLTQRQLNVGVLA